MTDKQPPKKEPAKKPARKVAKKVAPASKPVPAKKAAPAPKPAPKPAPAKKAPAKKKRVQNPAPKQNSPTPHGKAAAARKVAARKAAGKASTPTAIPDSTKAKENAAKAVSALIGEASRAVGRPTKYSDEIIPMMLAYFNIQTQRIVDGDPIVDKHGKVQTDKDGNVLTEKKVVVNKYPTMERFAANIGVNRDTLLEWATVKKEDGTPLYPEFSGTYTRCKDLATALLIEGGLEGNYEARIVQFALKNIGGWRDQIDTHIEGSITTTSQERLDDIYAKGIERSRQAAAEARARQLAGVVPGTAVAGIVPIVRPSDDEDDERDENNA